MPVLLAGALALILMLSGLGRLSRGNPQTAIRVVRAVVGLLVAIGAFNGGWRSRLNPGAALGAQAFNFAFGRRPATGRGRWTEGRSRFVFLRLDHDTGAIEGRMLGGPFAGRDLASLSLKECLESVTVCRREDPDGARLLETYLDRRFAAWRQAEEGEFQAGRGGDRRSGAMSRQQAYQTLGLKDGATGEEIVRAHRTLMKKFHPDRGGSTAQAALVNEAKDVLLTRHGTP